MQAEVIFPQLKTLRMILQSEPEMRVRQLFPLSLPGSKELRQSQRNSVTLSQPLSKSYAATYL